MNTKAGLGVSPIISVAYSVSTIWDHNFGNTTLLLYSTYILIEMVLHVLQTRPSRRKGERPRRKLALVLLMDGLQFPLSLVFTRFLNLFTDRIPDLATQCAGTFWGTLPGQVLFLLAAIVLTGVGAALSLNARLIPNPGDGIVQALSDTVGKGVGLTKNWFDITMVALTCGLSLLAAGHLVGIGLGTVLSMIGVGRVIAVFNYFAFHKIAALSGLRLS